MREGAAAAAVLARDRPHGAGAPSAGPDDHAAGLRQLLEQRAVIAVEAAERRGEPAHPEHQHARAAGVLRPRRSGLRFFGSWGHERVQYRGPARWAICDHGSPADVSAARTARASSRAGGVMSVTPRRVAVVLDGPQPPAWQVRALSLLRSSGALEIASVRTVASRRRGALRRAHAAFERHLFAVGPDALAPQPLDPARAAKGEDEGEEPALTVWLSEQPLPAAPRGSVLHLRHAARREPVEDAFRRAVLRGDPWVQTEVLLSGPAGARIVERTVSGVRPYSSTLSRDRALWKIAALVRRAAERAPGLDEPAEHERQAGGAGGAGAGGAGAGGGRAGLPLPSSCCCAPRCGGPALSARERCSCGRGRSASASAGSRRPAGGSGGRCPCGGAAATSTPTPSCSRTTAGTTSSARSCLRAPGGRSSPTSS